MTTILPGAATLPDDTFSGAPETFWADVRRRFVRNKVAMFCLLIVIGIIVVGIFANQIAPYGYDDQFVGGIRDSPGGKFLLGTDQLGRDLFSRIVFGARLSIMIALGTVIVSLVLQMLIGGIAGWRGGWFDTVAMRICDALMAIPYVAIAFAGLTIFTFLRGSLSFTESIIFLVVISVIRQIPTGARQMRALVLQYKGQDYIEAARAVGCSERRIVLSHLVPNIAPQFIAGLGQSVGVAIINESAYSFLGVGVQEPQPSWGLLLAGARGELTSHPHLFWAPAICFAVTITAFLFVTEGLRDATDPKLRGA